jgi:hypothetical protein
MKLAEALILRADMQKRLAQLKQRILDNAKVQQGDQPAEAPEHLLGEFEAICAKLQTLIQQINRNNAAATLADGQTLADALAQRDILQLRHAMYRELGNTAVVKQNRFSRSEVKFVSTVKVGDIQAQADELARAHRELDAAIQAVNWQTELQEIT